MGWIQSGGHRETNERSVIMTAMKKESSGTAKKPRKPKLTKEQMELAQRYEKAWHKFYYQLPRWKQEEVINDPEGRSSTELAHTVRVYVDTNEDLKD